LLLITSLSPDRASPEQLGDLYRLRWRIELAFKRLKSLLHIVRLPAKQPISSGPGSSPT
jgi:IS4 transposase